MNISDVMTRDVQIVSPNDVLRTAAQMMSDYEFGAVPVGDNDRLVGMLSDRDITTRAVARGLDPEQCKVKEVMSADVFYVFDDESVEEVALNMGSAQVRRMPVVDRDKRLVGIVSLGDIAQSAGQARPAAEALEEISQSPPNAAVYGAPRRRSDGKARAG